MGNLLSLGKFSEMIRNSILTIILLLLLFPAVAQESKIFRGSVTDKRSGEPVAYANIGIEGTFYGAASTIDGYFEFKVPAEVTSGLIFASAVGYQGFRTELQNLASGQLKIELDPTAYDIGVVDVTANSLVLYKAIRDAIEAIGQNYPQSPVGMTAYYKNEYSENHQPPLIDEAMVELADASGYKRENPSKEQLNRNYRVRESRRNFEVKNLAAGMNRMDNLLSSDIVRSRRNILDQAFLKDYDLSADATTTFEGIPVWVINYTLNNPSFDRTGIYNVKSYQGKIYISKNDHAILKNELWVRAVDPSPHGLNIASSAEAKKNRTTAEFEMVTIYKKSNGKYLPAYIKTVKRTIAKDLQTGTEESTESESFLLPTSVNTTNPELFRGRDYYSGKPFNKSFWDSFNLAIE